ncbi:MAG: A24 family peptidase, partial [Luminiphilus sp.]|nr:A24 family peptidase [Luminiphilus sp.]
GLVVGSFLNVVIYRLPKIMESEWRRDSAEILGQPEPEEEPLSLAFPGSQCPACGTDIKPWHNVPVVSYLALRGQCSNCSASISLRYPMVEAMTAVVWIACGMTFGVSYALMGAMILTAVLICLTAIDLDTQLLPDSLTLPLLWIGLILNLSGTYATLENAVFGAVAGYLSLWSVYWGFKLLTGKEGMGYGDFKLLAALGAWFGIAAIPTLILASSLVGAVVGILLIVTGNQGRDTPMPFGPFLAGAGLLHLFFPNLLLGLITGA